MRTLSIVVLLAVAAPLAAQDPSSHAGHKPGMHGTDSAFAATQARGRSVMGVDQYTSTHVFDALPDGGRIELQSDRGDSADVATIRAHIRDIGRAFAAGDFTNPSIVHDGTVPGTQVLAARRAKITYEPRDLPRGAELRIRTTDPDALRAIKAFMAYQRVEHRARGRS